MTITQHYGCTTDHINFTNCLLSITLCNKCFRVIHIAYIILPETISLGCVYCLCVELYNVVLCTHTVNIYEYTPESKYMCVFHANAGLCILSKIMNAHITELMYVMQCYKSTANPTSVQLTVILATTNSPLEN